MDVLTTLMIIGVAAVAGETVIRVARARVGGATQLQAHLDQLQQQCDDQASALAQVQSHSALCIRQEEIDSSRVAFRRVASPQASYCLAILSEYDKVRRFRFQSCRTARAHQRSHLTFCIQHRH